MPWARHSSGSCGGIASAAVTTRKKSLHLPRRLKRNQDLAALLPHRRPDMGHAARCQDGITGVERHPVVPDLDQERALHGVEPLVLGMMQVARRAALGMEGVFEDEETGAVLGRHLERNGANAEAALQAEAVSAGRDEGSRRLRGRSLRRVGHGATSVLDDAWVER